MTTTNTYRMPARSLGMGSIVRRRTPAGATIDHVIDRIEHRAGDEVRIDLVDPANGWGAFLVLDGNEEVEVVVPADEPADVCAGCGSTTGLHLAGCAALELGTPSRVAGESAAVCFEKLPRGRRCVRPVGHPGVHHDAGGNGYADGVPWSDLDDGAPATAELMPDVVIDLERDTPRCTDVVDGFEGCTLDYDHEGKHEGES